MFQIILLEVQRHEEADRDDLPPVRHRQAGYLSYLSADSVEAVGRGTGGREAAA